MEHIITFQTTNQAIKGESILMKNGIGVTVMPLPSGIKAGCGLCLRVGENEVKPAVAALEKNGIDKTETFLKTKTGVIPDQKPGGLLLKDCSTGGCGAKIGPEELSSILGNVPVCDDSRLLVGFNSNDDGAVYQIDEEKSIITTVDFFPPMVDAGITFGRIAAANALSDIYAMGGRPLTALNLVCFPEAYDIRILGDILRGGAEKVAEAGAVLAGGHSIYDKEPKYGLAVTGIIENNKILRNNTPLAGHKLILTKPLGVGIVMAAYRARLSGEGAVEKAVASMERLNRYAAEKLDGYDVSACTDVTGFGLLAHLLEMAGETVSFRMEAGQIPYLEEAYQYAEDFILTAAGQRNRNFSEGKADVGGLPFAFQELLFDPQTSGGLLICVADEQAEDLLAAIQADDPWARIIGRVITREREAIMF